MEVKLQKWGNSFGIRIPISIVKSLNIRNNAILNIEESDKKIIVSIPKQREISLSERFKEYKGKNLAKDFSWDKNVGREIW